MSDANRYDTVVVGAGWAGLTAASKLAEAGQRVVVIEKSRGPGGRSATRREGKARFDHGAQYFTARSAAFGRQVADWRDAGWIAKWTPRLAVLGDEQAHTDPESVQRFVALPGMNGICRQLAASLDCRFETRVSAVRFAGHWTVELGDHIVEARRLLLTAPPAQAAELLGSDHLLHDELAGVLFEPCIALMAAFEEKLDARFDAAFVNDDSPLRWIARDSSKPGRAGECWVAHATGEWSRRRLEDDTEGLAAELLGELCRRLDVAPERVRTARAHRWRYAQVAEARDDGFLSDHEQRLAVAGDWLAGSRVEGAWTSGRKAAEWLADLA
ncbi:FAD-dependent oxidoreductase [Halomonas denitrificans]|nr:FAD-dependent oxidoreductase [Halomonas denitrificans]